MVALAPSFETGVDIGNCEFHAKLNGFWSVDTIQTFFDAIAKDCQPLMKARKPIYSSINFSDFVPQDSATGTAIQEHLQLSQKFGLRRLAVIGASALVKIQYQRLSEGIKVEFFDDTVAAHAWLRKDR